MASSKHKAGLGLSKGCFPDQDKRKDHQDDQDDQADDEFLTDTKNEQLILGYTLNNKICQSVFAQQVTHRNFLIGNHQVIAFCIERALEDDVQLNDDIFDVYRYQYPGQEKSTGGLSYISKLRRGYSDELTSKTFSIYVKKLKSDYAKYRIHTQYVKQLLKIARDPSTTLESLSDVNTDIDDLLLESSEDEFSGFKTMKQLNIEHDQAVKDRKTMGFGHTGFGFINEHLSEGFAPGRISVLAGRPGMGKCLTIDTPILMADGSVKKVQDVRIGDQLMGPDSNPRNVLELVRGESDLFQMVPKKGDEWGFNRDHIHSFRVSSDLSADFKKDAIHNLTIAEYEELPSRVQYKMKLWRSGVEFDRRELPFDPRWIGLWLGDGSRGKTQITNSEPELALYFESFSTEHGLILGFPKPNESGWPVYSFSTSGEGDQHHAGRAKPNPLLDFCRSMVVDGEKRIPNEYLISDRQQRLFLLAGLLDSDGFLTSKCFEITTKYKGLCDDILFLSRSLGFAAYAKSKIGSIKDRGFEGVYHKIVISGLVSDIPCLVERRKSTSRLMNKNVLNVGFRYEQIKSGQYYGFQIDGDQLFMLGDFTVTHNSAFVANSMIRLGNIKIPNALFAFEMDGPSMIDRMNAIETGIDLNRLIKREELSKNDLRREEQVKNKREGKPIYITDKTGKSLKDIRKDLKKIIDDKGVRVCFIDLFMKIKKPQGMYNRSTNDQYTAMLNELQIMARELNVHISIVVQIGRKAEARTDKRPTISDLKDSGGFEEIADLILLFYREAYYISKNVEEDFDVDLMEIIIGKQRQGRFGVVKAKFQGEITKILKCQPEDEKLFKKMLQILKPGRGKKSNGNSRGLISKD